MPVSAPMVMGVHHSECTHVSAPMVIASGIASECTHGYRRPSQWCGREAAAVEHVATDVDAVYADK